jgi:hypothetical protein
MTHHCPRSNWTGPESALRRGICPKCAETTLYEDCSVRPVADSIVVETHRTRCGVMREQPCTCTPTRERFYRDGRIVALEARK